MLAYIDPMAGTVVLQVVLAAAVGVIVFLRRSIVRAFTFLVGRKSTPASNAQRVEKA